jgi:hypothetical protein
MERRRATWAAVLVALAACAALPATTTANKISVNWMPNTNYTVWEQTHGPFYKGDWLGTYAPYSPRRRHPLPADLVAAVRKKMRGFSRSSD